MEKRSDFEQISELPRSRRTFKFCKTFANSALMPRLGKIPDKPPFPVKDMKQCFYFTGKYSFIPLLDA